MRSGARRAEIIVTLSNEDSNPCQRLLALINSCLLNPPCLLLSSKLSFGVLNILFFEIYAYTTLKADHHTSTITFLVVEIGTVQQTISLPQDKLTSLLAELQQFSRQTKCTKRTLLSLIGKLAFAAKAIPADHIFTRSLIDASTLVQSLHHHICLSQVDKVDINWWLSFTRGWNCRSFFLEHT